MTSRYSSWTHADLAQSAKGHPLLAPVRNYVTMGVLLILLLPACTSSPPPRKGVDVQDAVSEGLCLAQLGAPSFDVVDIDVVRLDGTRRTLRIPAKENRLDKPTSGRVSPDGTYLAGVRSEIGKPHLLVGLALDGGKLWQVENELQQVPAISPDGKNLAFATDRELGLYDIANGELRTLGIEGQDPAWSPDGRQLAYDDGADPYDEDASVYVYDLNRNITARVGRGTQPSWLPDGTGLAVRMGFDQVELVNLQSRARRKFLSARLVSVPRWSPNGRWMMYTYEGGGRWWSLADAACEPDQIMVRDTTTGAEMSIGAFCKANPGDYTWVTNKAFCGNEGVE